MTRANHTLTRRQVAGLLATAGGASTGLALAPTVLSGSGPGPDEPRPAASDAGLKLAWRKMDAGTGNRVETSTGFPIPRADVELPVSGLGDASPGDRGYIEFALWLEEEPAFLSLVSTILTGDTEPGEAASSEGQSSDRLWAGQHVGEGLETTVSYIEPPTDDETTRTQPTTAAFTASLASVLWLTSVDPGIPLDGARTATVEELVRGTATPEPFEGQTVHGVRIDWTVRRSQAELTSEQTHPFGFGFAVT